MKSIAIIIIVASAAWLWFISTTQQVVVRERGGQHHARLEDRTYSKDEVHNVLDAYRHDIHEVLSRPLTSPLYPSFALLAALCLFLIDSTRNRNGSNIPTKQSRETSR